MAVIGLDPRYEIQQGIFGSGISVVTVGETSEKGTNCKRADRSGWQPQEASHCPFTERSL